MGRWEDGFDLVDGDGDGDGMLARSQAVQDCKCKQVQASAGKYFRRGSTKEWKVFEESRDAVL
jgi:predicted Zn-dependent protease